MTIFVFLNQIVGLANCKVPIFAKEGVKNALNKAHGTLRVLTVGAIKFNISVIF